MYNTEERAPPSQVEPKFSFIVDIPLSVPPVPHALQFDEQLINRIRIAAMFNRFVTELK